MKEAILLGMLSMGANVDDNKIEIQQVVKPVTITVNNEQISSEKVDYIYSITEKDTKADVAPHIIRHINS
jgi:hypothetical protein